MPYEKRTKGNRICVYKKTTGKKLSCYSGDDAEKRADDYLAALNANMPEEEKENIVVAKESDIDAFLAFKGGPGSGNKGHAGIKGHKGGSAPGGGGGGGGGDTGGKYLPGAMPQPASKGYSIQIEGVKGYFKISNWDDISIEKLVKRLGKLTEIPIDPRTDFPSFSVYEDGEELGGG